MASLFDRERSHKAQGREVKTDGFGLEFRSSV